MPLPIFIEGDFPSGKGTCQHHCTPTCHPLQVGPETVHGCLSPSLPYNRSPDRDFCPIVDCGGNPLKCEIPPGKRKRWRGVQKRRLRKLLEHYRDLTPLPEYGIALLRTDLANIENDSKPNRKPI